MKKTAILGVFLAFSGICGSLYGHKHTFENGTQYPAEFIVSYILCKDLKFTISPGESQEVHAGPCVIKDVSAIVVKSEKDKEVASPYMPKVGYAGSSTWAVIGPVMLTIENPTGSIYKVSRLDFGSKD